MTNYSSSRPELEQNTTVSDSSSSVPRGGQNEIVISPPPPTDDDRLRVSAPPYTFVSSVSEPSPVQTCVSHPRSGTHTVAVGGAAAVEAPVQSRLDLLAVGDDEVLLPVDEDRPSRSGAPLADGNLVVDAGLREFAILARVGSVQDGVDTVVEDLVLVDDVTDVLYNVTHWTP